MRKIFGAVLFLILHIANCQGQDSFAFDRNEYVFDTLYQGDSPNAVFLIKNTGNEPIYLKVKAECSCLSVSYSDSPIPPGKCSLIQATLAVSGREGLFNDGLQVLIANDRSPERSTLQEHFLPISAFIAKTKRPLTEISFKDKTIDLGDIKKGYARYLILSYSNIGGVGAVINEIRFNGIDFLYSAGDYHYCSRSEEKALVGSNEVISGGHKGTILLKLAKADLGLGQYKTTMYVFGNFKEKKVKLKFRIVD